MEVKMKSLIIVYSYHHNNTSKVANNIADVLNSDIKTPDKARSNDLEEYDLVGFGSGIDSGKHYKELLDFAESIININTNKKCFIFSTSGVQGDKKVYKDHSKLREILQSKGYDVLGEFSCKGFNTNSILKYIGGINKNHPDDVDINNAKQFAFKLLSKI